MNQRIIDRIKKIVSKDYSNSIERVVESSIVIPMLSDLGWDTHDSDEVLPQHKIDNRKVDYSLRIKNKDRVFVEVKKTTEELDKHENQLLDYSFRSGIEIAILTNGIEWWFYLPILAEHWEQRKFYSINLKSSNETEVAARFIDFLSFENISSGQAVKLAHKYHNDTINKKEIEKVLPIVWNEIIASHFEPLVDLLITETKKKYELLPAREDIEKFLDSIQILGLPTQKSLITKSTTVNYAITRTITPIEKANKGTKAKDTILNVLIDNKTQICEKSAIETFKKTILFFGIDIVKRLEFKIAGKPCIAEKELAESYDKRYYKEFENGYYVFSYTGNHEKEEYLKKVANKLGREISVDIIPKH